MTMTLDHQQQRYGAINFDHMSSYHTPHFTNPWAAASSPPNAGQGMYQQPLTSGLDILAKQHPSRTSAPTSSMASFGTIPVTASSAGSTLMANVYGQQDLLNMPQDLLSLNRLQPTSAAYGEPSYATATSAPSVHSSYTASPPSFDHGLPGYATAPVRSTFALAPEADHRRYSQSSIPSSVSSSDFGTDEGLHSSRNSIVDFNHRGIPQDDRRSFADALDAGHGMLAMSQETPRAIYPPSNSRARGSTDSYGFPPAHSTTSSISSASNYGSGSYYGGSIDSSVSDYSTGGSDIESVTSRTLPRPTNLMTHPPPAPQSMMGQFSSKVSSSTQKKHKCKVCDKRFTRPSSLQTHMYSHTGEKPFCCEVEGCGRHFSVVSNLRRHRKVHKNDAKSEAGSEDRHDDSE
ncbi:hypothetical protein BKA67DRAFT_653401 [Truncatella angustata]|uniref:C2H2-type domain-containing protein n=1 Tax=Truncatella angustata TaxID=152316 RepID=A0A9P8UXU3_9PEZI|nr:uncharacterized protein BKA67DRAFT_653401 [Truncatella angustata]KAH6660202.1 hypothetical protein BKA67DRAFT_653401 [Truncatella angustata]KAH8199932.1 hypothetical protein TruAng_005928 [Truncatella angustata]